MESMSPAEQAKFLFKASQPARDRRRAEEEAARAEQARIEKDLDEWARNELAALVSRVRTKSVEVPLDPEDPDSPLIRLRTHLSEQELNETAALIRESVAIVQSHIIRDEAGRPIEITPPIQGEVDRQGEIARSMVATVTANPAITVAWLQEHPDAYATEDFRSMVAAVADHVKGILEDRRHARTFLDDPGRQTSGPDAP
jgi:hypothetical protein